MSDNKLTLNLEQALKLAGQDSTDRPVRIIGALSAARILLGDEPIVDDDYRQVVVELVASLVGTVMR